MLIMEAPEIESDPIASEYLQELEKFVSHREEEVIDGQIEVLEDWDTTDTFHHTNPCFSTMLKQQYSIIVVLTEQLDKVSKVIAELLREERKYLTESIERDLKLVLTLHPKFEQQHLLSTP